MEPMVLTQNFALADIHREMVLWVEKEEELATAQMEDLAAVVEPTTAAVVAEATLVVAVVDGIHCIQVVEEVPIMPEQTKAIPKDSMMDMVKYLSINCNN